MEQTTADNIGTLLTKISASKPRAPTNEELNAFKELFDENTLTALIERDEERVRAQVEKLEKRSASFKERLALGAQAIAEARELEPGQEAKASRRKRIKKLVKKQATAQEQELSSAETKKPEAPAKPKFDVTVLDEKRRVQVSSSLEEKIAKQLKKEPVRQQPPAPPLKPPPAAPLSTSTAPAASAETISADMEAIKALDELGFIENSATTAAEAASAASEPEQASSELPPIIETAATAAPQPAAPEQPTDKEQADEFSLAKLETKNLQLFPTIAKIEIDEQELTELTKKSNAILNDIPYQTITIDTSLKAPPSKAILSEKLSTVPAAAAAAAAAAQQTTPEEPALSETPPPISTEAAAAQQTTPEEPALSETPPPISTEAAAAQQTTPEEPALSETPPPISTEAAAAQQTTPKEPALSETPPPIPAAAAAQQTTSEEPALKEAAAKAGKDDDVIPFIDLINDTSMGISAAEPSNIPAPAAKTTEEALSTTNIDELPDLPAASAAPLEPAALAPDTPAAAATAASRTAAQSIPDQPAAPDKLPSNIDLKTLDFETPTLEAAEVSEQPRTAPSSTPDETQAVAPEEAELDYGRAFHIIRGFQGENRTVILNALQDESALSHAEADTIAKRVLANEDEAALASFVRNLIFKKQYRSGDVPVTASVKRRETRIVDEFHKRSKAAAFLKRSVLAALLFLVGFFVYQYGIDYTRSVILYERAYRAAANGNVIISEEYFNRALAVYPRPRPIHRIGKLYHLEKHQLPAAEQKYLTALQVSPAHKTTLLSYIALLIHGKRFDEADKRLEQLKTDYGTQALDIRELDGEYHIAWGRQTTAAAARRTRLERAKFIYSELINEGRAYARRSFYLARLLETSSLNHEFANAQELYEKLHMRNSSYLEARAFTTYLDYLSSSYAANNNMFGGAELSSSARATKNNQLVNHAENVQRKLYAAARNYLPFYYTAGRWNLVTGELNRARQWTEQGIALHERSHAPFEFEPAVLYGLTGELQYRLGDIPAAETLFERALTLYAGEPTANYYFGKLELQHRSNYAIARRYLLRALEHLDYYARPLPVSSGAYLDLQYSLGYTHYAEYRASRTAEKQTAANSDFLPATVELVPTLPQPDPIALAEQNTSAEIQLERALVYWNELLAHPQLQHRYILDYAAANTYLRLGRYALAEAKTQQAITELSASYEHYTKHEGAVTEELHHQVSILSDLYNNLGVAKAEQRELVSSNPYALKQAALENFINAIIIKNKLELLSGPTHANFNTLNYESQERRGFLIADQYIPDELLIY